MTGQFLIDIYASSSTYCTNVINVNIWQTLFYLKQQVQNVYSRSICVFALNYMNTVMLGYFACFQHYGFNIESNSIQLQYTKRKTVYPFIHSISLIGFDMHTYIGIWLCVFYESRELCKYDIPSCVWLPVSGCEFGVPSTQKSNTMSIFFPIHNNLIWCLIRYSSERKQGNLGRVV